MRDNHLKRSVLFRLGISLLVFAYWHGFSPLALEFTRNVREAEAQVGGVAVIKITSPTSGSAINDFAVLVRGALVVPPGTEVGVTVNGIPGFVDVGQFAAMVPVDTQVTSLTATAKDANGNVLGSDTIPVTVQSPTNGPTLFFRPMPVMGIAPLTARYTLTSLEPIALITLDADGNGTPDFVGTSLEGQTFTYDLPGLYFPKVTVLDTANNTHTATAIVQALTQSNIDGLLQTKWTGLKNALRNNDIAGALNYIATARRTAYQEIFNALTVPLTQIDQVLTTIQFVEAGEHTIEYEMLRTDERGELSYPVRFGVDEDGIWRIQDF